MKERFQTNTYTKFGFNLLSSPLFSLSLKSDHITDKYRVRPDKMKKLIIIPDLDLGTICKTHARQIKSGTLIKWLEMNVSVLPC